MPPQNIKIYLVISFALIVLFILILVIPFTKKTVTNNQPPTTNFPTPTSIEINLSPSNNRPSPYINSPTITSGFTGAIDEKFPKEIIDLSDQKKDLLKKVPFSLAAFKVEFNYSEDKFIVTLKDPKDQAQKVFDTWIKANYPALGADLFIIK